jgi:hypothetical protein
MPVFSPTVLPSSLSDSVDYSLYVYFCHLGVDWQGNDALENGTYYAKVLQTVFKGIPVVRVQMVGDEMNAYVDILLRLSVVACRFRQSRWFW